MPASDLALLTRLPSAKAMLAFNIAARHLNLVRAAAEMRITQGALSRQIKALEDHLGVRLFERRARGLGFTQEGELLYDFTSRAFETLGAGVSRLTLQTERQTLVLSVARSFALRVLVPRLARFAQEYPHIDLSLDIHRYFADIATSGLDVSIRLGAGDWRDCRAVRLTRDHLFPVCSPSVRRRLEDPLLRGSVPLLRNVERDHAVCWSKIHASGIALGHTRIDFNDSATMLLAAESGMGLAVSRTSLVATAIADERLVRPFAGDLQDGLDYYAVCTEHAMQKPSVRLFSEWLAQEFDTAGSMASSPLTMREPSAL